MMFELGQKIKLVYPTRTEIDKIQAARRRTRKLVVKYVRDLMSEPLSIAEYTRRPFIARSRWLVTGFEPSKGLRQFYIGSSDNFRAAGILRIGLYEPGNSRPSAIIGSEYGPTIADRRALLRFAREQEHAYPGYEVRIFASDLRLIS